MLTYRSSLLLDEADLALADLILAYDIDPETILEKKFKLPRAWQAYEDLLKKDLGRLISQEANRIASLVDTKGIFVGSENTWKDFRNHMLEKFRVMFPLVSRAAVRAAKAAMGSIANDVDWNLVNRKAENWARAYSFKLVTNLSDTSQAGLQRAFAKWIAEGKGDAALLRTMVFRVMVGDASAEYGSDKVFTNRANAIATTETTRIYAEANAKAYQEAGCAQAAFVPPAHVNCRCYIRPKRDPDKNWVMVWHTAYDELVCTKPIVTQWGTVIGCKGMHSMCISHGKFLGQKL